MNKYLASTCFLIALASLSHAQSGVSEIISPAGTYSIHNGFSLEWTLGETAVSTGSATGRRYTQGFNQPQLQLAKRYAAVPSRITVTPNPVVTDLFVQPHGTGVFSLSLTDVKGVPLMRSRAHSLTRTINMRPYAPGVYLLQVFDARNVLLESFRVVKL